MDKVLEGIARDLRDGIEAKPAPKPSAPDPDASESQFQDESEHDGQSSGLHSTT